MEVWPHPKNALGSAARCCKLLVGQFLTGFDDQELSFFCQREADVPLTSPDCFAIFHRDKVISLHPLGFNIVRISIRRNLC